VLVFLSQEWQVVVYNSHPAGETPTQSCHMKHQFPSPHPAKKRRTQSFIPEDAWSIIASFLPIKEQFSVLFTSKCIQQSALNNILQDTKNSTILFKKSVRHGYNVITRFILSHDLFDPSVCYKYDTTIQIASYYGRTEAVQLLLNDNRVDPSGSENDAIRKASENGHVEVVRLLLSDNRVDPSARNNYAIRKASENGHVEAVQLLLSNNRVDPSDRNNHAIRKASSNGHVEITQLLLNDDRVDPSDRDNDAIRTTSHNGYVEIVYLLLNDSRVDPSAHNNYSIKWASSNGHVEVVRLLLSDDRVDPSSAVIL
jgi:ankyrin repeat protein